VAQMDHGASLGQVAQGFSASSEFRTIYGAAPTDEGLVGGFYHNVLGRAPEPAGLDYWVGVLHAGSSAGSVLASISESAENVALVAPRIANGIALDLAPFL
jgi:serralysin